VTSFVIWSNYPGGMYLSYRYRILPTGEQQQALARAFGCARVVYNDGLRLREGSYKAGLPHITDGKLLQLVTTEAKKTPERRWLTNVSAVVLQQSVADLNRAYHNYFQALSELKAARAQGESASLRIHRPRFKSKHDAQSVRFTANSRFRVLPNGWLRLPKVGNVRIRWSRPLPAEPSSVTITLDRAGRYHASFVVEVAEVPLPVVESVIGIDLGLSSFVTLSTAEKIDNPRWLRKRERALRHSQRSMSRKQKGSRNQERARQRLARRHGKVADARRDFHHQLSTRLVRENQVVIVETLNIAAMGRSNLAKSLADAGWGQFIRMLEYKSARVGRSLAKVDRWHPSSQICSDCGARSGPRGRTGLHVRAWTCSQCGIVHDRDVNAAKNILAAGRAVTACGPAVSPGVSRAVGDEAGTTPTVAV
jgi:IS605 OrfB family transposase